MRPPTEELPSIDSSPEVHRRRRCHSSESPPPKRIERARSHAAPGRERRSASTVAKLLEAARGGLAAARQVRRLSSPARTTAASVFSVASMVEPGTFDLEKMAETLATPAITLFAQLPGPVPGMHALNELVACATGGCSRTLGGTLQDDRGVPLTVHRIERMRQEVREFERPASRPGAAPRSALRALSEPDSAVTRPCPAALRAARASCARRSIITTTATTCSTIRKSRTPSTTGCCASCSALEAAASRIW